MMAEIAKVGVIACSGEEIPAGTVTRLATRRVLELLRPHSTVTLCLPLFLAGEERERRFARQHPTITVDGCDKLCAKRGTEQFSGKVAASLVASEIVGNCLTSCHRCARDYDQADEKAVRGRPGKGGALLTLFLGMAIRRAVRCPSIPGRSGGGGFDR